MENETKDLMSVLLKKDFDGLEKFIMDYLEETKDTEILFVELNNKSFLGYAIKQKNEDLLCAILNLYPEIINHKIGDEIVLFHFVENKLKNVLSKVVEMNDLETLVRIENGKFFKLLAGDKDLNEILLQAMDKDDVRVLSKVGKDLLYNISGIMLLDSKLSETLLLKALEHSDDLKEIFEGIYISELFEECSKETITKISNTIYSNWSQEKKAEFLTYAAKNSRLDIIIDKLNDSDFDELLLCQTCVNGGSYYVTLIHAFALLCNENFLLQVLNRPNGKQLIKTKGEHHYFEGSLERGGRIKKTITFIDTVRERHFKTVFDKYYRYINSIAKCNDLDETTRELMLIAEYYGKKYIDSRYASKEYLKTVVKKTPNLDVTNADGKTAIKIAMENDNENVVVEITKEKVRREETSKHKNGGKGGK